MADVNGDGEPDLITAGHDRHGTIAIWLNGGAGRFVRAGTYVSAPMAWAVAAADVNRDEQWICSPLTTLGGSSRYWRALATDASTVPSATWGAARVTSLWATSTATATPDVALAIKGKRHLAVRLGRGDGSFADPATYKAGYAYAAIVPADVNRDQILDVATGSDVMLGAGDGTFRLGWQPAEDLDMDATAAADLDADGNIDLLSEGYPPDLLLGDGHGRFHVEENEDGAGALDVDADSQSGAVADFNGDGLSDLALIALCDYDCDFGTVLAWLNWTGLPAKPCVVPDVTQYLPIGETLRDSGCQLGRVSHRHSRTPKGWAIGQRPRPGTVLPSGTRVDVVVSLGRRHHHAR